MTQHFICDNAAYEQTTLTQEIARDRRYDGRRSITYFDDDRSRWDKTIRAFHDFHAVGPGLNLLVFNTEASGTDIHDYQTQCDRLAEFLTRAEGAVDAVEPGNELDTPAWGISDDIIIEVGKRMADICDRFTASSGNVVKCLSPSLLTGPGEGRFSHVADELGRDRAARIAQGLSDHVDGMAIHVYYCSVGGWPASGWYFGTLESKCHEAVSLSAGLLVWVSELGCPVHFDDGAGHVIGEERQRAFAESLAAFNFPGVEMVSLFTLFRGSVPQGELNEGKDWHLVDERTGERRPAYYTYGGSLVVGAGGGSGNGGDWMPRKLPAEPNTVGYEAEFLDAYKAWPELMGLPAQVKEHGPSGTRGVSSMATENGIISWVGPRVRASVGGTLYESRKIIQFLRFEDLKWFTFENGAWSDAG
jgi:hypothetical protein